MPYPVLSSELSKQMELYRMGLRSIPQEYIDLLRTMAEASLPEAARRKGWIIRRQWMGDDGWCDGMKFVHAEVEKTDKQIATIKFADNGRWYEHSPTGGWFLLYDTDDDCPQPLSA